MKRVFRSKVKYRRLREIKRRSMPFEKNWHGDEIKTESDVFAFKRKLSARNKIEELLEEKDWL
jgi:hypothetical protein